MTSLTVSADWMRACWGIAHPVEMPIIHEDKHLECVLGRCFTVNYGMRDWVVFSSRCDRVPSRNSDEHHETNEQLDARLAALNEAKACRPPVRS